MAGYLSWLFPRCKISPKLNGTAPHFGDEMFALVLFVCYLDGGCEDIVVDVYNTEQQCLLFYERSTDPPGRLFSD